MSNKYIKYIEIEGTDGSGKFTTSLFIAEVIKLVTGKLVDVISFPQHNTLQGSLVDAFLYKGLKFKDNEFQKAVQEGLLYSIDRMITMNTEKENGKSLKEEVENGEKIVIFDRYVASNFIHRSKYMDEEDLEDYINIMEFIEFNVMGIPRPDMTFVLKVDPEISYQNILNRGREMDDNETLENITEAYNKIDMLCKMKHYIEIECCKTEDGKRVMKSTKEIADEIIKELGKFNK